VITQCPACKTLFRVVPDQLRLAEGWVRCGDCGEVFDAGEHLQNLAGDAAPADSSPPDHPGQAPAPAPAPAIAPPPPIAQAGAIRSGQTAVDVLLDDLPATGTPGDPSAVPHHPAADAPRPALDAAFAPSTPPPVSHVAATADAGTMGAAAASSPSHELAVTGSPAASREPAWYAQFKQAFDHTPDPGEEDELDSSLDDVSFVRKAGPRAAWESNAARGLLGLLAVALAVLLALQVVVHQRDRFAAAQPQMRPFFDWLCRPVGCSVQPLRQIEAVVIDNSSFNRQGPDSYRLSVGLRNSSPVPVAAPWLELTLTDAGDQPVLRRVLSDRELGLPPAAVIAGGSEWSTTLTLTVTADANTARIAGYRLLAFYP
jgi:predicted Zn finger-like uncharacterized protein